MDISFEVLSYQGGSTYYCQLLVSSRNPVVYDQQFYMLRSITNLMVGHRYHAVRLPEPDSGGVYNITRPVEVQ